MTDNQKKLIRSYLPNKVDDFLAEICPNGNNDDVVEDFLSDAFKNKSSEEVELSLLVGHCLGLGSRHIPILLLLLKQEWHTRHEDIVRALDPFASNQATESLVWAAHIRLPYLDYDDSLSLARKAIYALSKIDSDDSRKQLELIAREQEEQRAVWATERLGKMTKSKPC